MNDYVFGNFLYELRQEKGLSQTELGKLIGVSNKAVSKWEMGISKPRPDKLLTIAEFFGVTIEELLSGKRADKKKEINLEREELSIAINVQLKEYNKARKRLIASVFIFVLSTIAFIVSVSISQAIYKDVTASGWSIALIFIFIILFYFSFIQIIIFSITVNRRKFLLYESFPARTDELNTKTNLKHTPVRNNKISVKIAIFAILALAVCLLGLSVQRLESKYIWIIELSFISLLAAANILFTNVSISKVKKQINAGNYKSAISKGKWLIEKWLPNGNFTLNNVLRLLIAIAYFSLGDDKNFQIYIRQLNNKKLLFEKSYWQCIYHFSLRNTEAFNVEYNSVFLPLALKNKRKSANIYSEILLLVNGLVNNPAQPNIKEKLYNLVKNSRVKEIIELYGKIDI